jgi:uncharacterized protein (TIGR02145 family)
MRNKIKALCLLIVTLGALIMLSSGCNKDNNKEDKSPQQGQYVIDIDGNVYHTVIIGTQQWMVENLKVTKYRNGDPIPILPLNDTIILTGSIYNYPVEFDSKSYGRLYNWFAVDDVRGLAPKGWHVPNYDELKKLRDFLGGESVAGGKLKESGTKHWRTPNEGASNETGFKALPGNWFGEENIGLSGDWWSSSLRSGTGSPIIWSMFYGSGGFFISYSIYPWYGVNVRCIKD